MRLRIWKSVAIKEVQTRKWIREFSNVWNVLQLNRSLVGRVLQYWRQEKATATDLYWKKRSNEKRFENQGEDLKILKATVAKNTP